MMIALTTWTRRPHRRRGTARAGPDVAPRADIMNTSEPIVSAKIRNARKLVRNPPMPRAKTATAARNGPVQPTPTNTNPPPNR